MTLSGHAAFQEDLMTRPSIWVDHKRLSSADIEYVPLTPGCTCSSCQLSKNILPWLPYASGDVFRIRATGTVYRLTGHYNSRYEMEAIWPD